MAAGKSSPLESGKLSVDVDAEKADRSATQGEVRTDKPAGSLGQALGLSKEECEKIQTLLGRVPSSTEWAVYAALWSEPLSAKNSLFWTRTLLPEEGSDQVEADTARILAPWPVTIPLDKDHACVLRMEHGTGSKSGLESLNRALEGELARPLAQWGCLHGGDLASAKNRKEWNALQKGLKTQAKASGISLAGGKALLEPQYGDVPAVDVLSVGILDKVGEVPAKAQGEGNPVFLLGAATGREALPFDSSQVPAVAALQVSAVKAPVASKTSEPAWESASPDFSAKKGKTVKGASKKAVSTKGKGLGEVLSALAKARCLLGMQGLGVAGLVAAAARMCAAGAVGMHLDLDELPLAEAGMEAWEILLSGTRGRVLVVVDKEKEQDARSILEKSGVPAVRIGEVEDSGFLQFRFQGETVAALPASSLVPGCATPVYERKYREAKSFARCKRFDIHTVKDVDFEEAVKVSRFLCARPALSSRFWVREALVSKGKTEETSLPAMDSDLMETGKTGPRLGTAWGGSSPYVSGNPMAGGGIAVAEAARRMVCSGGKTLGLAASLEFGASSDPEAYWQFVNTVKGMKAACERFRIPVGDVRTRFGAQLPGITAGLVGLYDGKMGTGFTKEGHSIYLLGKVMEDISASHYLREYRGVEYSPAPYFDLDEEYNLQRVLADAIESHLVESAHSVSEGGLMIALLESAMVGNLGFDIMVDDSFRLDSYLFGEGQGRVIVTIDSAVDTEFKDLMMETRTPMVCLGEVTKGRILVDDYDFGKIEEYKQLYTTAIESKEE